MTTPSNGRAVITGAAGFVGRHLTRSLLDRGYAVTGFDNLSTGRMENVATLSGDSRYRFVRGSIHDVDAVDEAVRDADVVFHLAAAVGVQLAVEDPLGTIETNVNGTSVVLEACARHSTKVLIASTSEVYGKLVRVPAQEDDDVLIGASSRSRWSYAASKLVDEFLALGYHRQRGLDVVVFRLFNTVGPGQSGRYGMVIPRFVAAALAAKPIPVHGDGGQSRSFLHVVDAVAGVVALAEEPGAVGQVFNVGGSDEITMLDLAQRVLSRVRPDAGDDAITLVPYTDAYADGFEDIRRRVADTTKLRSAVGWKPTKSLDDIIDDVAAEMRSSAAASA